MHFPPSHVCFRIITCHILSAKCKVGAFEGCSKSFFFLRNPSFIWLFACVVFFNVYILCFPLVCLGHLQECCFQENAVRISQDGFKSCVAFFNEGGHGWVNSTWLWPSTLPIPQLSNQRHATAHAKYMLMCANYTFVYSCYLYYIKYYIILYYIIFLFLFLFLLIYIVVFETGYFNTKLSTELGLILFDDEWLKTHGFRRKLLFKLCLGQSHRGSGMHGHAPCLTCCPTEIEIRLLQMSSFVHCLIAKLRSPWSFDLSNMGDCCSVMFLAWFLLSCGHKPRTAWNSLWTFMNPSGRDKPHWINFKSFQNCLSNKVICTDLTPCRAHRLVPPWLQHKSEQ